MKRLFIFIAICLCWSSLTAQTRTQAPVQASFDPSAIRERIYVATDKDNYVAGEIVWMRLLTTDEQGAPLSFSKVGYVELAGEDESAVRTRIELRGGVGEGSLVLPSNLPTGYYRLVGYTRWMWNEGPELFFDKRIGVVNPILAGVPRGSAGEVEHSAVPYSDTTRPGGLNISSNGSVYSPRSEVRLDISGIPADIHSLGVSVTAVDPVGGFTAPALGEWKQSLPAVSDSFSGEFEAEYEGALVTGNLVSTETGEAVYSSSILPLAAFPGDRIDLFSGTVDRSGRVVFRTNRAVGYDEIVTTMRGNDGEPWRIDLDLPFWPENLGRPSPSFPIETIDPEAMRRQSLAVQLQYSYVNDSLLRHNPSAGRFTDPPYISYRMDEWRRFATMREVMTEFVMFTQFSRVDGKRYLSVVNRDFQTTRAYSLVLLDGIPIIDHEIIYNYNPLLLSRIDVYPNRYLFGGSLFYGMVALYTAENRYPELQPDPFTQILPYDPPQARRLFYAPDYTDPSARSSRVPDYRHTLYWNADVPSKEGHAELSFFTSDLRGRYRVLVEGITASGETVGAVCDLEVR